MNDRTLKKSLWGPLATPDRTTSNLARILSGFGELVLDIPCRQHANPLLPTTWTTSVTIKRSDDACKEMLQKWTIFDPRQVPLWCRARFELDQTLWITGSHQIQTAFLSLGGPVLSIITLNINQSCEKMDNFDWSRDVVGHVAKRSRNVCLLSPYPFQALHPCLHAHKSPFHHPESFVWLYWPRHTTSNVVSRGAGCEKSMFWFKYNPGGCCNPTFFFFEVEEYMYLWYMYLDQGQLKVTLTSTSSRRSSLKLR